MVESRYAEALLAALPDPQSADAAADLLCEFSSMLTGQPDLHSFMLNPTVPLSAKKASIEKMLPGDGFRLVRNFFCILVDKGRMDKLPVIYRQYKQLKDARQKILEIFVYSSHPLDPEQLDTIRERYRKQYGSESAVVIEKTNPALLGGVRIQIGDVRINDTIQERLSRLRQAML